MEQQKLKDAIRIISRAAKDYDDVLNGYNYIFIYKNRQNNQIEFFESTFLPRNFQHLTGIEFIDAQGNILHNPTQFYQKCLNSTLKESDVAFKDDGTTELKLQALPNSIRNWASSLFCKNTTSICSSSF